MQSFRHCPYCGVEYSSDQASHIHKHCQTCGKWIFENLKATGSAVIIQDNKLLLVKRGIEPFKGKWDVVGGFSEPDEHPEETTRREVKEELGVDCVIEGLYGIYSPIPYTYQGYTQHNCDLYYRARLLSMDLHPGDDAVDFRWFPLDSLPDDEDVAFLSAKQVIRELKEKHQAKKENT